MTQIDLVATAAPAYTPALVQVPLESLVIISSELHELATHLEQAGYSRTAEQIRLRARALAGLTGPDVRTFLREQVEADRAGEQG